MNTNLIKKGRPIHKKVPLDRQHLGFPRPRYGYYYNSLIVRQLERNLKDQTSAYRDAPKPKILFGIAIFFTVHSLLIFYALNKVQKGKINCFIDDTSTFSNPQPSPKPGIQVERSNL